MPRPIGSLFVLGLAIALTPSLIAAPAGPPLSASSGKPSRDPGASSDPALERKVVELIEGERFDEARALCESAITARPADARPVFLLARVHELWGRTTVTVADPPGLTGASTFSGTKGVASRTDYKWDPDHFEKARASYEKAVDLAPQDLDLRAGLALFYTHCSHVPKIRKQHAWFAEKSAAPDVQAVIERIVEHLVTNLQYEVASEYLGLVAGARPDDRAVQLRHAWLLARSARPEEGRDILTRLHAAASDDATERALVKLDIELGDAAAAAALLEPRVKRTPADREAALALAWCRLAIEGSKGLPHLTAYMNGKDNPAGNPLHQALVTFQQNVEKKPALTGKELCEEARKSLRDGLLEPAWAYLSVAAGRGAGEFRIMLARAEAFGSMCFYKKHREAVDRCRTRAKEEKIEGQDFDSAKFQFELGKNYFHRALCGPSLLIWSNAAKLPDADGAIIFHVGRVHEDLNKTDLAREWFRRTLAVKDSPSFVQKAKMRLELLR